MMKMVNIKEEQRKRFRSQCNKVSVLAGVAQWIDWVPAREAKGHLFQAYAWVAGQVPRWGLC